MIMCYIPDLILSRVDFEKLLSMPVGDLRV